MNSRCDRATGLPRHHLGWAVCAAYLTALLLPGPGTWLRQPHAPTLGPALAPRVHTTASLLALVLFSAGLQVPVRSLGRLLRRPGILLAGTALHLAAPLLIIPPVVFLLRQSPDADGGSGLVTAMILIVAMPLAAGATVWTGKGQGDLGGTGPGLHPAEPPHHPPDRDGAGPAPRRRLRPHPGLRLVAHSENAGPAERAQLGEPDRYARAADAVVRKLATFQDAPEQRIRAADRA
ncbi:hypothetical protein ACQB60_40565 [Actinomycetota bacterium Odt1-20B]